METPHREQYRLNILKHVAAAALLLGLGAIPCSAQSDSTRPAGAGDSATVARSASAATDSAARQRSDSAAPGAAGPDSAAAGTARADSAAPGTAKADSVAAAARAVPKAPMDSVLAAACGESRGSAPNLLVVTFRPTSTESERDSVALEVGGTLLGMTYHTMPPGWFLRVPGGNSVSSVADRLILLPPVLGVSTTTCP